MHNRGKTLKVALDGRGALTLRGNNYLATGGEGVIYKAHNSIIKLYQDARRVERDDIGGKVALLRKFSHPSIVVPRGLVFSDTGKPIGIYMDFVSGEPLARVFTNDFRKREAFGDRDALRLVDGMRETVLYAHDKDALLVDPNELNWVVRIDGKDAPHPYVIDVDSWEIGKWKASAVMPSIRDWHTKGFSEASDWFAWGVVTFQVFTGIHPYKGKLDGFRPGDLEQRMRSNASVFEPGVRLNRAVRDFGTIPGPLFDWYVATFQDGDRMVPPSAHEVGRRTAQAAMVKRVITKATGSLVFEKILDTPGDPVGQVWPSGIVRHASGKLSHLELGRTIGTMRAVDGEIVETDDGWLVADWANGKIDFSYINKTSLTTESLTTALTTSRVFRSENRLFAVTDRGLTELSVMRVGKPVLTTGKTWGVMVGATRWFDGVGVEDAIGATHVVLPYGDDACAHVRVPELDGLTPVAARAGKRFVTVVLLDSDGEYQKFELWFNETYTSYTIWSNTVENAELNLTILPRGVYATIIDDGELVVCVPSRGDVCRINDKNTSTNMALARWDNKVVYVDAGSVWHVHMR